MAGVFFVGMGGDLNDDPAAIRESPRTRRNQASFGFHVLGDRLLDANGIPFVMRGVNHGHVWFPERMDESLDAIAATGANCVRLVLSCGGQWRRVPGQ